MKFRSGTLERSVKRWGRFPGKKLQRVQHSWKYVELANTAVSRDGATPTDIAFFTAVDFQVGAVATGVKNVAFDLCVGLAWTPTTDAANIFHNASVRWGIFCLDADDVPTGATALEDTFATQRALKWGMFARNWQGQDLTAADGPFWQPMNATHYNFRVRGKQRFVKFDEELRFILQNSTTLTDVMGDQRLHIWGRVSWETP